MVFTVGAFLAGRRRGRRPGRWRGEGPGALRRFPPPARAAAGPGRRPLSMVSGGAGGSSAASPLPACPFCGPRASQPCLGLLAGGGERGEADFSPGPQGARGCVSIHRDGRASGRAWLTSMIATTLLRNLWCATFSFVLCLFLPVRNPDFENQYRLIFSAVYRARFQFCSVFPSQWLFKAHVVHWAFIPSFSYPGQVGNEARAVNWGQEGASLLSCITQCHQRVTLGESNFPLVWVSIKSG